MCEPGDETTRLDAAWRIYSTNAEWSRHADSKIAALTAANGAVLVGIMTLAATVGLSKDWTIATVALSGLSFLLAGWPLVPDLATAAGDTKSKLYFGHVADYETSAAYVEAHVRYVVDAAEMEKDLAQQTWQVARIARKKYRWTGWSSLSFMFATVAATITLGLKVW